MADHLLTSINLHLLKERLAGCKSAHLLEYARSTDSTNTWAARMVESGEIASGTVFLTDEQTAGKGRFDKPWFSPKFTNMTASLVIKNQWAVNDILYITVIAALAVQTALQKYCGIPSRVKWPNDLLVDGKKVCGILIENTSGYFIIGIGININSDTAQQREIANNATSLRLATGRYFERESIIAGVIRAFEEHTHQFSKDRTVLFDKWKNSLLIPEGDIELVSSGEKFHGRVTGISPAGSLEFRTTDGHHLSFNSVESY